MLTHLFCILPAFVQAHRCVCMCRRVRACVRKHGWIRLRDRSLLPSDVRHDAVNIPQLLDPKPPKPQTPAALKIGTMISDVTGVRIISKNIPFSPYILTLSYTTMKANPCCSCQCAFNTPRHPTELETHNFELLCHPSAWRILDYWTYLDLCKLGFLFLRNM